MTRQHYGWVGEKREVRAECDENQVESFIPG